MVASAPGVTVAKTTGTASVTVTAPAAIPTTTVTGTATVTVSALSPGIHVSTTGVIATVSAVAYGPTFHYIEVAGRAVITFQPSGAAIDLASSGANTRLAAAGAAIGLAVQQ